MLYSTELIQRLATILPPGLVYKLLTAGRSVITFPTAFQASVVDSTTYNYGANGSAGLFAGAPALYRYDFDFPCVIKTCRVSVYANTPGSAEPAVFSIVKNGSESTVISSTVTFDATAATFSNTALDIEIAAGDYIYFELVTPAWATNPESFYLHAEIGVEFTNA